MSKKKRFGGWEIIEDSRGRRMEGRKSQKEEKGKQAASCVSQFSQLRHFLDNPTVHIEDQWVENNISKFQLNPTVDEVAMIIFPKGSVQRLASSWPAPAGARDQNASPVQRLASACQRLQHQTHRNSIKHVFLLSFSDPTSNLRPKH